MTAAMDKFILTVNPDEDLETRLLRVPKRTNLLLKPGPRFLGLKVALRTNYPVKRASKFQRQTYYELPVAADHQDLISSAFNWHVALKLELAGTYHFVCSQTEGAPPVWRAYVVVEAELPKLALGHIRCQTVLTRSLGPLREWRQRLAVSRELKYNMIHFTPVQELGASGSAYALRNQLRLDGGLEAGSLDEIRKEVEFMEKKWCMLSVTDVVLNHTADDSGWIREHPECAYNTANSPHLRPAALLDAAFVWLMQDLLAGHLQPTAGLSASLRTESELQSIGVHLRSFYVAQLKIWEMFMVDVGGALEQFHSLKRQQSLEIDYHQYERHGAKVVGIPSELSSPQELERLLVEENKRKRAEVNGQLDYAIGNALGAIRYERLDPAGPYFQEPISEEKPLVAPYFSHTPLSEFRIAQEERLIFEAGERFMAHNGWVAGGASDSSSPSDFASATSQTYLKRELIAWGDCIKLRYGANAQEVPHLWDHMRKYVEAQAKVFHGLRLDNCHSTPMHVAEFMVDAARAVRPDIYIMAELFTSSEAADNVFVNRLGISALIREAMAAHDARELGRLLYRYGGTPVGAFKQHGGAQGECLRASSVARAIFFDQTHDNASPVERRSAHDAPATAALLSMANCATGSTRGYDELVPHHINVVTERRLYQPERALDLESGGLLPLRRLLNGQLLRELAQGFEEIFVDQLNEEVIAITRHNPQDGRSIVLVARTAFSKQPGACPLKPICVQGTISRLLFEAQAYGDPSKYERDQRFINGLASFKTKIFSSNVAPAESKLAQLVQLNEDRAEIRLNEFQFLPSSVMALEICLSKSQTAALRLLNQWRPELNQLELTLSDINYILFRCAEEDRLEPYELPNMCKFTYAGLHGLMHHLKRVRANQDQAHPLAMNLRQGGWLAEYTLARLRRRPTCKPLADHLERALKQVELLPRGMVPKYFDLICTQTYQALVDSVYQRMSVFVAKGPELVRLLALASVALVGECESAPMPACDAGKLTYLPSIAAGLPHFSSGYMRNWGRDTFIALRGLLLITGRFSEAKAVLLSYGRTLRHGLIPNLLDGGARARYNCRDAVWWWLYSVREYTKLAPNGSEILRCKLKRLHKPEERAPTGAGAASSVQMNGGGGADDDVVSQQLCDTIQEALECHFNGKQFVEERAGKQLDEHMQEQGFRVTYGVDRETGLVFGGNRYNCGTWMDKMGSSEKAGTKGLPASPRDGSAVEIVGLCKAVVSWLDEMYKNNRAYPYDGVETLYDNTITLKWTWKKWASLIQANFERLFYVPLEGEKKAPSNNDPHPELINRRGIYKDTLGASLEWQDYQLRPNFLVSMVVAPELFDKQHARRALGMVKEHLCGPLGMRTLDPSDWNYSGYYDNANDTTDKKIAHGYNYHQGPEWLWLTGYYIRASQKFVGSTERAHHLKILANFHSALVDSAWLGLPELTNSNGSPCPHSCPIQAWSLGTALEALHESARG